MKILSLLKKISFMEPKTNLTVAEVNTKFDFYCKKYQRGRTYSEIDYLIYG